MERCTQTFTYLVGYVHVALRHSALRIHHKSPKEYWAEPQPPAMCKPFLAFAPGLRPSDVRFAPLMHTRSLEML